MVRSACLHDLGKANSQFQRALQPGKQLPQALRHEFVGTWLLLAFPKMDEWLFGNCGEHVRWAALLAVLGHHLKVRDGESIEARDGSGDSIIDVFCDHPDFCSCLNLASHYFGPTSAIPALPKVQINLVTRPQLPELHSWMLCATEWYEEAEPDTRRFVALTKALMIAADVAGSAVPKIGIDPAEWTVDVLTRVCLSEELDDIALTRLQGQPPRDFQKMVAESRHAVTFVKAGCGSGKTIAAYLWAARQAIGRKLFFCYPTTGTATEGFRDYIIPAEMPPDARLLHSRAECDLKYLVENPEDDALQNAIRLESLSSWDVPLVLCTVDQVLWLIQNGRRALFSSPAFANGAFVFDEIHQYDDRLFSALLRFIDAFRGAPTLLMTASLPQARLKALQKVLERRGDEINIIEGSADLERIPRYTIGNVQDQPPWSMIDEVLTTDGKVLWVTNTVDRCVEFADQARKRGYTPMIYHSRYRYLDRIGKHSAVIKGFQRQGRALAVTTQVCEVSLDLSADLLITDLAPAPALIQRMGRLNRRVTPQNQGSPKPMLVLQVKSPLPYQQAALDLAQKWLGVLGYGPHSQAILASSFEQITCDDVQSGRSAWLDDGPFSQQVPLREAGATIPIVRAEDEPMCVDSLKRPITEQITRYTIPMPLRPVAAEIGGWKRIGFAFVAPVGRVQYSDEWGARWQKE
jgi:CRISPR-associated endonuclease/helicase Cas3